MPFTTVEQLKSYLDQGNHLTQEQNTQALRMLAGWFACPPLASLLPQNVRVAADAILRARDVDEARNAIDDLLRDPAFLPSITLFPKGLARDVPGDMIRLRHALGDKAGTRAGVGVRRVEALANAISQQARPVGGLGGGAAPEECVSEDEKPAESLMDFACADMPVEFSKAVLALGRGIVAWIVILRKDEGGGQMPTAIVDLIADLFANGAYPLLRLTGSLWSISEDVLPKEDIINFADAVKTWHTARREADRAADAAMLSGVLVFGLDDDQLKPLPAEPDESDDEPFI
jgi:hypothetical protein